MKGAGTALAVLPASLALRRDGSREQRVAADSWRPVGWGGGDEAVQLIQSCGRVLLSSNQFSEEVSMIMGGCMSTIQKLILILASALLAIGLATTIGHAKPAAVWSPFLPVGVVSVGLFLISVIVGKEAAKSDEAEPPNPGSPKSDSAGASHG